MLALSQLLGVNRTTVIRWIKDGCPAEKIGGAWHLDPGSVADWIDERGRTGERGRPSHVEETPDLAEARARKEHWLARKHELDAKKKEGQLVDRAEVLDAIASVVLQARQAFLSLPGRVCDRLAMRQPAEILDDLDAEVRQVLAALADGLDGAVKG